MKCVPLELGLTWLQSSKISRFGSSKLARLFALDQIGSWTCMQLMFFSTNLVVPAGAGST